MDLKKLYYEAKSYIDIVDFPKLWRGFEPLKFALYTDNECFFDGAICYDTGALMLYIMTENNIAFEDGFSSVTFAEAILSDVRGRKHVPKYSIKHLLDSYNANAKATICKAIEKNILVIDTPCNLLGVNVYNAVFYENYIISRYCVMFGSDKYPQIEYGDFVIETNEYGKITKIYRI